MLIVGVVSLFISIFLWIFGYSKSFFSFSANLMTDFASFIGTLFA